MTASRQIRNRSSIGPIECISTDAFERGVDVVRAAAASPNAGVFGPASMTWRINRESAIFLGAGRALLLQLTHPWVAAAVAEHSSALTDPIGRFHRTFNSVFTMVFGTLDQALSTARHLNRRHAKISGTLPAAAGPFAKGSHYAANDRAALRWVHATLVDTSLLAYNLVRPSLTSAEREQYWAEARLFAALFGLKPNDLPSDWRSFTAYMEAMTNSNILTVGDAAKELTKQLFSAKATQPCLPMWYRALTAQMLPLRLRGEFGLVSDKREQLAGDRAVARVRLIYPLLPYHLRFVGPYQEAQSRLNGRSRPGLVTQLLNRFWIGQNSMSAALPV